MLTRPMHHYHFQGDPKIMPCSLRILKTHEQDARICTDSAGKAESQRKTQQVQKRRKKKRIRRFGAKSPKLYLRVDRDLLPRLLLAHSLHLRRKARQKGKMRWQAVFSELRNFVYRSPKARRGHDQCEEENGKLRRFYSPLDNCRHDHCRAPRALNGIPNGSAGDSKS